MIGAIVGDIVGSRFEWCNLKSKCFAFFDGNCLFTDDSVMTVAIADAILRWCKNCGKLHEELSVEAVNSMREFGCRYPGAGYGGGFLDWLRSDSPRPYNSWGNGAAMRVSACGWAGRTLDEVKAMSRAVTEVTHNHPEGIKGAEGGDSDTIGAICGAVAGAFYGVSNDIRAKAEGFLDPYLLETLHEFEGEFVAK